MEITQVLSRTALASICSFRQGFFVAPELRMLLTNAVTPGIAVRIAWADLLASRILAGYHVLARKQISAMGQAGLYIRPS